MRTLVTGGNGFVGTHLVRALRERGIEPIVAGHSDDGEGVDIPLDLRDAANVRGVVELAHADAIVHLAALAFVPAATRDPLDAYDVNALGTARLLDAVRACGAPFPRVLVASSAEVYGPRAPREYPVREDALLRPATPYAASKAAAEAFAGAALRTYGVPTIVVRAFNAIGPGQDDRFAVAGFAAQLARIAAGGAPLLHVGNLDAQRDFLDVRDLAAAYVALLDSGTPGEAYNACSGRPLAIKDVLRALIGIARIAVEVREDPARMRPSDLPLSYGDAAKLTAATGWQPVTPLATSLRDAYEDARGRLAAA
jgi:GDP-4-dehydro-6-deoxy-D-mannose reductase